MSFQDNTLPPNADMTAVIERINALNQALRPFQNVTGQNGIRTWLSDGNLVIESGATGVGGEGGDGGAGGAGNTSSGTTTPIDYSQFGTPFTPGDDLTPGGSVAYSSRSRGGTASLLGFSEYTAPNNPPKKYLVKTLSGADGGTNYNDSNCTSVNCTSVGTYSGSVTYNATTGAVTDTGYLNRTSASSHCTYAGPVSDVDAFTANGQSLVLTQTTKTVICTPVCNGYSSIYVKCNPGTPDPKATLSSEDTEANAVARLLATSPSWSGWGSTTVPGANATWAYRGNTFDFSYGEAELKIECSGFPNNWPFVMRVLISRTDVLTSVVSDVEVQIYNSKTDGSGAATVTAAVTPEEAGSSGYVYKVQSVTFLR